MLNEIDSEEITLYLAAEGLAPMDDPWTINGINCYVTAKAAGIKCKEQDFLPRQIRQQSEQELSALFKARATRS